MDWVCRNETQGVLIGEHIKKADNYFTRLFGLLPRSGLKPGEGLWIVPCREIHSIGMRFVFDALFLDKDLCVVHTLHRMKPFRVIWPIKHAESVLELDAGVIETTGCRLGDQLSLTPNT